MKVGSRLQLLLRVQEEAKKFPAPPGAAAGGSRA